jgi:hypothetical protein
MINMKYIGFIIIDLSLSFDSALSQRLSFCQPVGFESMFAVSGCARSNSVI